MSSNFLSMKINEKVCLGVGKLCSVIGLQQRVRVNRNGREQIGREAVRNCRKCQKFEKLNKRLPSIV